MWDSNLSSSIAFVFDKTLMCTGTAHAEALANAVLGIILAQLIPRRVRYRAAAGTTPECSYGLPHAQRIEHVGLYDAAVERLVDDLAVGTPCRLRTPRVASILPREQLAKLIPAVADDDHILVRVGTVAGVNMIVADAIIYANTAPSLPSPRSWPPVALWSRAAERS